MSKNKEKITTALRDSIKTLGKAWDKWDKIEKENLKKRPYANAEERLQNEAGELLKHLKNQLDHFS